jgi:hypothetical protein
MKRECLWRIVIGLSLGVGLVAIEPGYADSGDHPQCNLATLKGRYRFGGIATLFPPAPGGEALLAVAGIPHLQWRRQREGCPVGHHQRSKYREPALRPSRASTTSPTPSNAHCSGTYTVPAASVNIGLFVSPNGEEVIVIGLTRQPLSGWALVQGPNKWVSKP